MVHPIQSSNTGSLEELMTNDWAAIDSYVPQSRDFIWATSAIPLDLNTKGNSVDAWISSLAGSMRNDTGTPNFLVQCCGSTYGDYHSN
jgi:hypothetical protein